MWIYNNLFFRKKKIVIKRGVQKRGNKISQQKRFIKSETRYPRPQHTKTLQKTNR